MILDLSKKYPNINKVHSLSTSVFSSFLFLPWRFFSMGFSTLPLTPLLSTDVFSPRLFRSVAQGLCRRFCLSTLRGRRKEEGAGRDLLRRIFRGVTLAMTFEGFFRSTVLSTMLRLELGFVLRFDVMFFFV